MQVMINQQILELQLPTGRVVLDVLRDTLDLKGTKEGCREGDCGACTVLIGRPENDRIVYDAVDSCLMPMGDCAGKQVVTIEGLNTADLSPLQRALVEEGAVQCGFCTPGLVMSMTAHLINATSADVGEAVMSVAGNICRCTGYSGIRRAIEKVLNIVPPGLFSSNPSTPQRIAALIGSGFLPGYFAGVAAELKKIATPPQMPAEDAQALIAGGTDIYVQRGEDLQNHHVGLLADRSDLKKIQIREGICSIGAAVTVETLRRSEILREILPQLAASLELVSSTQIRNRATVAGNIINASPIGDLTIMLLALDAEIHLQSFDEKQRRSLPLRHFFTGYKTMQRHEEELVTALSFAIPPASARFSFEKVSKRTYLDIASVNSALLLDMHGDKIKTAHLSAGGVAPIPLYLTKTSAMLCGCSVTEETIVRTATSAVTEISPISDVRGSARYKKLLLGQLIRAQLNQFLFP